MRYRNAPYILLMIVVCVLSSSWSRKAPPPPSIGSVTKTFILTPTYHFIDPCHLSDEQGIFGVGYTQEDDVVEFWVEYQDPNELYRWKKWGGVQTRNATLN